MKYTKKTFQKSKSSKENQSFLLVSFLLLFFVIVSLFYCLTMTKPASRTSFFTSVYAKSRQSHNTITKAYPLQENQKCSDIIPAYDSFYYQLDLYEDISITILSNSIDLIAYKLIDAEGRIISFQEKTDDEKIRLIPKSKTDDSYLFLEITNQSTESIPIRLFFSEYEKKQAPVSSEKKTAAPPSKTSNKSSTKKTHSSDRKKQLPSISSIHEPEQPSLGSIQEPEQPSLGSDINHTPVFTKSPPDILRKKNTQTDNELWLKPHFIKMRPEETKTLHIYLNTSGHKKKEAKADNRFTLISTNPEIVSISNRKLFAKKEGTVLIYICSKKKTNELLSSSSLIKVIKEL